MADHDIRSLERLAKAGNADAKTRLRAAKARAGQKLYPHIKMRFRFQDFGLAIKKNAVGSGFYVQQQKFIKDGAGNNIILGWSAADCCASHLEGKPGEWVCHRTYQHAKRCAIRYIKATIMANPELSKHYGLTA